MLSERPELPRALRLIANGTGGDKRIGECLVFQFWRSMLSEFSERPRALRLIANGPGGGKCISDLLW